MNKEGVPAKAEILTVSIPVKQKKFLNDNYISPSKVLQNAINILMEDGNYK